MISSVKTMIDIIINDYVVFKNGKRYIVDLFVSNDPCDGMQFYADCEHQGTDSYGVDGSDFNCCRCEDETVCKFAGSEFKHWSKTDPDPDECGCRIGFWDAEIGKTIFLTREECV